MSAGRAAQGEHCRQSRGALRAKSRPVPRCTQLLPGSGSAVHDADPRVALAPGGSSASQNPKQPHACMSDMLCRGCVRMFAQEPTGRQEHPATFGCTQQACRQPCLSPRASGPSCSGASQSLAHCTRAWSALLQAQVKSSSTQRDCCQGPQACKQRQREGCNEHSHCWCACSPPRVQLMCMGGVYRRPGCLPRLTWLDHAPCLRMPHFLQASSLAPILPSTAPAKSISRRTQTCQMVGGVAATHMGTRAFACLGCCWAVGWELGGAHRWDATCRFEVWGLRRPR